MSFTQPSLFGDDQPDLFGKAKPLPRVALPNPQHVRNRFIDFLARMRAAETWPWDENQTEFYREIVWPQLYTKLADRDESAEWKRQMDAEAARLDVVAGTVKSAIAASCQR